MYLRRCYRNKDGKRHAYWALVESHRTARGPRQRVVAWLGELDEKGRLAICQKGQEEASYQRSLFDDEEPEWIEVDLKRIAVERTRRFGGPWMGLELLKKLGLDAFINQTVPGGREDVPWAVMVMVLVLGRLCDPSSELHLAEQGYESSAMSELLGVPINKVNDDRLYRALDRLLPHKEALEKYLKEKLGELFPLDYDLLLYDVTSTYFEGEASRNDLAQRGYSRDHRPDCKQVNIALVVSRCGMPIGYEVFAGNRHDSKTVEQVVEHVEKIYGRANRIWVMDRGMVSEENVEYLRKEGRRYIVGTPKSQLRKYERELLSKDWKQVHEGLQVRLCPAPDGKEVFILCRSLERQAKEQAMHERFEQRIEEGLEKIATGCRKGKQKPLVIAERVGKLMGQNTRAAGLFRVQIKEEKGAAQIEWSKLDAWREWARLSEGCYMLRSNVTDWTPEDLWRAYIQLTEAEAAFRIQKSDLQIRPVWHQRADRVKAHILVCFLAYVLWKSLGQMCQMAGLGDEPRKVFEELKEISLVDVVLPTRNGIILRKQCVSRPSEHQSILLQKLQLRLPSTMGISQL
ncbi:MAG TPA: IS1634 family transposase [Acidobacteriota bacterium]|nr:IS1634 family transposase [Acidobacteriota bacterium]